MVRVVSGYAIEIAAVERDHARDVRTLGATVAYHVEQRAIGQWVYWRSTALLEEAIAHAQTARKAGLKARVLDGSGVIDTRTRRDERTVYLVDGPATPGASPTTVAVRSTLDDARSAAAERFAERRDLRRGEVWICRATRYLDVYGRPRFDDSRFVEYA